MSENVYKIIEIVGTSTKGSDDAIEQAIAKAPLYPTRLIFYVCIMQCIDELEVFLAFILPEVQDIREVV